MLKIPAMMTGMTLRMTRSAWMTPMLDRPTPDLAVPYAEPRSAHSGEVQ